jgi:SAM-dependent methyltransferase
VAHSPLQGRRADHRRRGRGNAGNSRRAARRVDPQVVLPRALEGPEPAHRAGQGERLSSLEELKAKSAHVWSSAPWEQAAHLLAPVHERLVRALEPKPGERWLDAGTGTGAVAFLAARAGADVSGLDLAPGLIETAGRLAQEAGLAIRFEVGDAEKLPVADESFDVVSSSMGVIFAPDHGAVARELARVLAPGGRLGFTAWRPEMPFRAVTGKYAPPLPEEADDSDEWGREEYVERMLGDAFELEITPETMWFEFDSGEAGWELLTAAVGPFKASAKSLEPERRDEFHREFVEHLEAHRADGRVKLPAEYLLVLGTRK